MQIKIVPASVSVERYDDIFHVVCSDPQGREYLHEKWFEETALVPACRLADRVREAGEINAEHWHCRVPYGTEAWDIDGMEVTLMDDEERYHKEGMFF